MKKLFVLSFASILLLTGCGATETMSCSYSTNANNGTTKVTYDIDHEGDEIKKVRITYNYDFDNNNGDMNNGTTGNGGNTDNGTGNNGGTTGTDVDANANTEGVFTDEGTGDIDGATDGNNNGGNTNNNGNTTRNNDDNANGNTNGNDNMTTYNNDNNNNTNNNDNNHTDGVGTGTDGTTSDTHMDDDGVVDGIVGSAIDTIVGGVTGIILDSAGLRDRHANVQNTYGNINGFSVQNTNDANNNYKVTYVIDYDTISDTDLATFNLTRNLDDMRTNYVNQGFTCK